VTAAGRTYRYIGLAMPDRKGTHCRCLVWPPGRASKKNALVQFEDGTKVVIPARTLRVDRRDTDA